VTSAKDLLAPSFITKFIELQSAMIKHNAGLTKSHPYQSGPETWPFVLRGISFWQGKDQGADYKGQIYLLGNPLIWWTAGLSILLFMAIWLVDVICRKRNYFIMSDGMTSHSTLNPTN